MGEREWERERGEREREGESEKQMGERQKAGRPHRQLDIQIEENERRKKPSVFKSA